MKQLLTSAFLSLSVAAWTSSADEISYNRDIRPILTENCFACHGPDSAARKADLRLDSFEAAVATRQDSKPAIVPGKPEESSVILRILTTDEDDVMPPVKTKKALKPAEKELLRKWVAAGANYEAHWSFIAPTKPSPPAVEDRAWIRNPVDAFVLARLKSAGLTPAEQADRATLARRVSLDLTGLPPSPGVVNEFVSNPSPDAYESLVDKLLASQRYGEHRARYWLDGARYADTHGIHFDNYREVWSYREWVINAFNDNMRFDQFTIEQLAGDLLPKPKMEQQIATGFNRCNMTTSEGGAINEEYLVLYARDRTETTSAMWMGLTTGCATCHDHKFDPLTQKEFYELTAFFNNTTQPAMDGNRRDTPPIINVPTKKDRARWEELPEALQAATKRIESRRQNAVDDFTAWLEGAKPAEILAGVPSDGLQFSAPLKESSRTTTVSVNGYPRTLPIGQGFEGVTAANAFVTDKDAAPAIADAGDFERDQSFTAALWVKLSAEDKNGAIVSRMNEDEAYRGWDVWLEDGRPGIHIVNKWPDDAIKVTSRRGLEVGKWAHVVVTYDGSSKAEGISIYIDGKAQELSQQSNKLANTIRTQAPFKIGQRNKGDQVEKAGVQDVRLYGRKLDAAEIVALKEKPRLAWLVGNKNRSPDDEKLLFDSYLAGFDQEFKDSTQALASLEEEEREIKKRGTVAHVMHEKDQAPEAYVLFRGEYDKRRDKVGPGTPQMLPPFAADLPRNRLGLAKWLLEPENPLTARVTVNRMWQELFGTGLVRTAGDFGITGETPSHQDLLDWLAVDFRENGWDMKRLYKMLVMSSTYRQAAIITPEKLAKDPDNRLLSRGPRFRMDAEMVRDYALVTSGLLSEQVGGPSVRPYQPDGVWEMVAMPESDTRNYKHDQGEKLYRRSLYTFWKRGAPPASMDVLNAPSRETCTVRRERTNTPLQALATLNDPQFVEAARKLAEITLLEGGNSDSERLDFISRRLLARGLKEEEQAVVANVLAALLEHYKQSVDEARALINVGETKANEKLEPVLLASYTMVANQMMNLDEVLNK